MDTTIGVECREMERARTVMDMLATLNRELGKHPQLPDALARILQLSMQTVAAESGSILLLDEGGQISHAALAFAGQVHASSADCMQDLVQHGLAGWVVENRQAALVNSTRKDPRWLKRSWDDDNDLERSAICVPLLSMDRVLGVLTLAQKEPQGFTARDLGLLVALAFCVSFTSIKAALAIQQAH